MTVVSGTDRAVTGGPERGTASRETQSKNRAVSSCFPSVKTPSGAAEPSSRQESERDAGHDCSCSEQDSRESRRGGFDSVLPEREYCFPGRAAEPSGKQLTHRSEDRMSVSGLCTRVPGQSESGVPRQTLRRALRLCRAGRGRDSQETAARSSLFFSRQGEKSERSGITLPDARGWSTQSDSREWGHAVP